MRTNNDNNESNNNYETSSRRHRNYYRRQRSIDDIMSFNNASNSNNIAGLNQEREEQARQPHYFHIISNEAFGKTSLLQGAPQLAIEADVAVEHQPNLVARSMHNRIDRKMFRELRMQHFQDAHSEMFDNWNGEDLELNNLRVSKKKAEKGVAERANEPKGIVLHLAPINNDLTFKEEPEDSDWVYYEDKKKEKLTNDKSKTPKSKTGRVSFV